jgi:hypothetical protein
MSKIDGVVCLFNLVSFQVASSMKCYQCNGCGGVDSNTPIVNSSSSAAECFVSATNLYFFGFS